MAKADGEGGRDVELHVVALVDRTGSVSDVGYLAVIVEGRGPDGHVAGWWRAWRSCGRNGPRRTRNQCGQGHRCGDPVGIQLDRNHVQRDVGTARYG